MRRLERPGSQAACVRERHADVGTRHGRPVPAVSWSYSPAPFGISLLLVSAGRWMRTLKSEDRGHNASGNRPSKHAHFVCKENK